MKICPWIWRVIHGRRPTPALPIYRPRLVTAKRDPKVVAFPTDRAQQRPTPART